MLFRSGKDDFYIQEPGNQGPEPSKGHFEISWIWLVPRLVTEVEADSSEQVLDELEGMRIEWSKSQAMLKHGRTELRSWIGRRNSDGNGQV